jgi:hypothetical protein
MSAARQTHVTDERGPLAPVTTQTQMVLDDR